jgi:hypothetical protein
MRARVGVSIRKLVLRDQPRRVRWARPLVLAAMGLAVALVFSLRPAMPPRSGTATRLAARRPLVGDPQWPRAVQRPDARAGRTYEHKKHPRTVTLLTAHARRMKVITTERAAYVQRKLSELRREGAAAVPAIADFLRRGEDVSFATLDGGELVGHRSLRQALIDALGGIGGDEAMAVSLEELQRTTQPLEIALLARNLEEGAPGTHGEQVMAAIHDALQSAERAPIEESPDVGPLFDLLRAYGGMAARTILEQSLPAWTEYALIALAALPEGLGVPTLTSLAEPANAPLPNPILPFQVLAQTTALYPQAGDALFDLARAGRIPDDAWAAVGEALEGRQLRFSGRMLAGTPLASEGVTSVGRASRSKSYYIQWLNMRYEEAVVSAGWSAEQIERQLALIDDLGEVASSPAAREALQQAQASLRRAQGEDSQTPS